MVAKVFLFSENTDELSSFLSKFYTKKISLQKFSKWKKDFDNPVQISEFIAAYIDNKDSFNLSMWISLDEDFFIKISPENAENVIKYIFERYPY